MPNERRHTLLIVDDEPDVLDSLRYLFHRRYRVHTATGAEAALELLRQEPIQLILSDQRMPGMSGDEFLARAREIAPDAIRMLFTGYADIQAVTNAINRGEIYRYVLKPWDSNDLELMIRQAAEQYDLLADRRRLFDELKETNSRLTVANRELAEADQLKSAFLEVASHELNTPITIVQGLAELLQLTATGDNPTQSELLRQIGESTRQLGRLVSSMLKLVGTGEFRNRLHVEPTDLASLLSGACDQVRPFAVGRNLEFQVQIAEDLGEFEVDADKVRDVILNLLTNAIKFTQDGKSIGLEARCLVSEGFDGAWIRIHDQGIGLDERSLRRLFSPFFTEFDPTHHSSGDFGFNKRGLGLGLFLVRSFVELHGGRVEATSEPDQGTSIVIRLPRHPSLPSAEAIQ
jgi:signal transduction histidine kinase